jgi:hypothetical protein
LSARDKNSARPWEQLGPDVAQALRPELPALSEEVIEAVSDGVPDYARPIEGAFGRGIRIGVEEALRQFIEMIERPGSARGSGRDIGREVYIALGRGEMRQGRPLDALLAAYRLGARVAWRRLAEAGRRAGLPPETLYLLAESIFAYIHELSAESAEGYAQEQSAAAGEIERRRRRLVGLLLQDQPADAAAVEGAARAGEWRLPRSLAALATRDPELERRISRAGIGAIAAPAGELRCVLVPDPAGPGTRAALERACEGMVAALGPTVQWQDAAASFERAALALHLLTDGVLALDGALTVADDHLPALLLHRDPTLVRDMADRRLAPLAEVTPAMRDRLAQTLLAWLAHQGHVRDIAENLYVHPQTVRYRLRRLRELFGDALDDPDARFELEIALRATTP